MRFVSSRNRCAVVGVIAALALVGVACGNGNGDDTGAPPVDTNGQEIRLDASEFAFDPDNINVSSGEFTVVLRNVGSVEHDFLIEGVDDEDAEMEHLIHAMPGETDRGDYDIDDGTYTFYCSIPGHRQSGMEGTLTVG